MYLCVMCVFAVCCRSPAIVFVCSEPSKGVLSMLIGWFLRRCWKPTKKFSIANISGNCSKGFYISGYQCGQHSCDNFGDTCSSDSTQGCGVDALLPIRPSFCWVANSPLTVQVTRVIGNVTRFILQTRQESHSVSLCVRIGRFPVKWMEPSCFTSE